MIFSVESVWLSVCLLSDMMSWGHPSLHGTVETHLSPIQLLECGWFAFNWNVFCTIMFIVIRITFWHLIVRLVFSITCFIIEGDMGWNVRKSSYIAHKNRITHYPDRKIFFMDFRCWPSGVDPSRAPPHGQISFIFKNFRFAPPFGKILDPPLTSVPSLIRVVRKN